MTKCDRFGLAASQVFPGCSASAVMTINFKSISDCKHNIQYLFLHEDFLLILVHKFQIFVTYFTISYLFFAFLLTFTNILFAFVLFFCG